MDSTRAYDFKHLHYVGQEGRLIPLLLDRGYRVRAMVRHRLL